MSDDGHGGGTGRSAGLPDPLQPQHPGVQAIAAQRDKAEARLEAEMEAQQRWGSEGLEFLVSTQRVFELTVRIEAWNAALDAARRCAWDAAVREMKEAIR